MNWLERASYGFLRCRKHHFGSSEQRTKSLDKKQGMDG
jgi:hypothetical protein